MDEIAPHAAWSWFGDPRAVVHNGQLYYGWIDRGGRVWVGQVDLATWTRRRFLLQSTNVVDDHGNPSIMIRGDRVVAFWSGHGDSSMRYRVAVATNSIAAFGDVITCAAGNTPGGSGFTYPNPVQMSFGDAAYLFWRGGNFQPTYSRSRNVGANQWDPAKHLFSTTAGARPYLKVRADGDSTIHFVMTEGHPRNVDTSIWYCRWELTDNSFRRADGSLVVPIGGPLPVPIASMDRVYNGAGPAPRAWTWDLQLDGSGNPRIAFAVLRSRESHEYWYARWTGAAWQPRKVADAGGTIDQTTEPHYSGGIVIDPRDVNTVMVSRQATRNELHRIEEWRTPDNGLTWARAVTLSDATAQNVRPFYARNAAAEMPWRRLWLRGTYGQFTDFEVDLVAGR